jgi:hypothetical protein
MSGSSTMAREQQVDAALELLAPPRRDRAECRHDIEFALDLVESRSRAVASHKVFGSKEGKAQLRRYRAAWREVQAAHGALDRHIRPWFSLAETASVAGTETVADREIKKAEQIIAKPSPPPRRSALREKAAVAAAHDLLCWWGHKASATKGGLWEQMAQVLADVKTGLHGHLRSFKGSDVPRVKKLQTAASSVRAAGSVRVLVNDRR